MNNEGELELLLDLGTDPLADEEVQDQEFEVAAEKVEGAPTLADLVEANSEESSDEPTEIREGEDVGDFGKRANKRIQKLVQERNDERAAREAAEAKFQSMEQQMEKLLSKYPEEEDKIAAALEDHELVNALFAVRDRYSETRPEVKAVLNLVAEAMKSGDLPGRSTSNTKTQADNPPASDAVSVFLKNQMRENVGKKLTQLGVVSEFHPLFTEYIENKLDLQKYNDLEAIQKLAIDFVREKNLPMDKIVAKKRQPSGIPTTSSGAVFTASRKKSTDDNKAEETNTDSTMEISNIVLEVLEHAKQQREAR